MAALLGRRKLLGAGALTACAIALPGEALAATPVVPTRLDESATAALARQALADRDVQRLSGFLRRRGLGPTTPALAFSARLDAHEIAAAYLPYRGERRDAYVLYSVADGQRTAAAFVTGEAVFAVTGARVVAALVRPENRGALLKPISSLEVATAESCGDICNTCLLYDGWCVAWSIACFSGCVPCCPIAASVCTAAAVNCARCFGC